MIEVNQVVKVQGKRKILDQVSFQIEEGAFLGIFGESGTGKTTLLNILGLLEKPSAGAITFDGIKNPTNREVEKLQREKIGYVFQNFGLLANESVRNNLVIGLKRFRYTKQKREQLMLESLEQVGLSNILDKKIFELSGGEQQRVALARVILKKPKYVFADEPTGNLDEKNSERVFQILRNFQTEHNATVVFVTHNQELIKKTEKILQLPM
ncbi:ABC transporter ATP-binding protein [Enterococcus sp. BWR-S5]|uniref:ABC transporter ATP-binding protein n=1 Tax=Enterococcus sp. BWR-S5 TaxID=2787714 RepID=UPI001921FF71|nr:ABC transporter ATP-binding protein [Enterococcus sp. BWR-S5]MBL1223641.1 ABC transporter ATP-binding protein [Enterococcus sp. BWR-S5]